MGEDAGDSADEWLPGALENLITGPGAVRDAGVDYGYGDVAAEAGAEQVGPEFRFGKDEQAGLQGVEVGAYGPGQVERAVKDALGSEEIAGQFLPSAGSGGDYDKEVLELVVECSNEPGDSEHLTDRDGMEPDEGTSALAYERADGAEANKTQALRQAHTVLMSGGHLPQPPRCAGRERRKQCEVVKKHYHA